MREIKFRGISLDTNELVYGLLLTNKLGTYIIIEENPHECTQYGYIEITQYKRVDKDTVGQYTGYQDEEWNDIYEGDIVDFIDYSLSGESEYGCRGEIIFEDGAWHVTNSIDVSELFNYDGGAIKVIGNIFENPELLEE